MRPVAPSPQHDAIDAERAPDIVDVVGALARRVGLEADAARPQFRGSTLRRRLHRGEPRRRRTRLVERQSVGRRDGKAGARRAGAALVDADDLAFQQIRGDRAALPRQTERDPHARIARPARQQDVRRARALRRRRADAHDGEVDRGLAVAPGSTFWHADEAARHEERRAVGGDERLVGRVAELRGGWSRGQQKRAGEDEPPRVHRATCSPSCPARAVTLRRSARVKRRAARRSCTAATVDHDRRRAATPPHDRRPSAHCRAAAIIPIVNAAETSPPSGRRGRGRSRGAPGACAGPTPARTAHPVQSGGHRGEGRMRAGRQGSVRSTQSAHQRRSRLLRTTSMQRRRSPARAAHRTALLRAAWRTAAADISRAVDEASRAVIGHSLPRTRWPGGASAGRDGGVT